MPVQKVAVIGAGVAGRAFALRCAQSGFDVVLEDVMPSKLRRAEDEYAEAGVSGVRFALTVEEAVADADVAIDFVPDDLESKLEIFSLLDRMAPPRTVLVTPTQTLSITDLASCTYRQGKCVGLRAESGDLLQGEVLVMRSRFVEQAVLEDVIVLAQQMRLTATLSPDVEQPQLMKNVLRPEL
ncbi:3-hydroxyacyl-CoA dehydrogenase NAD-binding domain-containing protein [Granulicella cerasi]|uniref:3-hydroxyacyl-CoA dehydrogenase NAD-binding domain-containing protein n=1 Tax=Granulicella cerasi TaxID=741063 RepID=A0ABW1ZEH3_9BACT|nr:3-hydroxyacyl-CoA dehydrogenase NAD-binding domain-containing protein [Granulicella cerasi]